MAIIIDDVSYNNELKNLSLRINENKITGIVGQRGSGKSGITDVLSGDFNPQEGFIYLEDKVGIVYQNIDDQFFYENIRDEFVFNLKVNGVKNIAKKMSDAVKMLGFNNNIFNKSIHELSQSEQKRISLALVLACNPKTIILDDIFFGLDEKNKNSIIKIIRLLKVRYKKTIVIISTDPDLIHNISDEVVLINNGSVLKYGDKYDVFTDEEILEISNLPMPKLIKFSKEVKNKKNIDLGYRDDINDLMKDIYRFVS